MAEQVTITLEIAPELEAELARRAARQGQKTDAYAAGLLERAAELVESDRPAAPHTPVSSQPPREVVEAIERLKSFGQTHRLSLGGMTIRELRHEARP